MAYLRSFASGNWAVVIEEDDCVGYAYLRHEENVVSDVWLYNRGPAPDVAPWRTGAAMPFQNPAEYLTEKGAVTEISAESLFVSWSEVQAPDLEVAIYVDGRPIAWLRPGAKPGWSALVKRDGPLARVRGTAD